MEKPILFFSHSSKDKIFLSKIKNMLLEKTSNTIEIFQSSDGESIPFGNNWVHKIEENLNKSKIMFVFISPQSVKSNWIYFESGFSYSKGVKVIPIGILGIDIGQLAPPINLLQGFNITSYEGLNNLISIINKEFSTSYEEDFGINEYIEIARDENFLKSNNYIEKIDYIETLFQFGKDKSIRDEAFTKIENFFSEKKIQFSKDGNDVMYCHGMMIKKLQSEIKLYIDQLKMEECIKYVIELLPLLIDEEREQYWIFIRFNENIDMETVNFKLSSRLSNLGIYMSEINGKLYKYEDLLFALDDLKEMRYSDKEGKRLRVVFKTNSFQITSIYNLIELLFDNSIIKEID